MSAAAHRVVHGLAAAWTDLFASAGVAFTSPVFAFPLAYTLVYGVGAVLYADRMGGRAPVFALAVLAGMAAYIVAVGAAWRDPPSNRGEPAWSGGRRAISVAVILVAVGVAAMIAYLVAIGGIPLFMEAVEEGRVSASERGGAALRVTSLLALPGVWILAAEAGATRRIGPTIIALSVSAGVAALHILTANRAPAFLTLQVTFVAYLLAAGVQRLRPAGLASVVAVAIALIVAAGIVGGHRFNASPATWRDPAIARGVATADTVQLAAIAVRNYLIVPIQNFSLTMDGVPAKLGWRLGYTYVQPIVTVAPGRQSTFDQDLKEALGQDYAGGGTVPSMLGESYANFGPVGWVVIPAIVGVVLTVLYRFARAQHTTAAWVLFSWVLVHVSNATISGLIVANIFPYIAAVILVGLAYLTRRRASGGGLADTGALPERAAQ